MERKRNPDGSRADRTPDCARSNRATGYSCYSPRRRGPVRRGLSAQSQRLWNASRPVKAGDDSQGIIDRDRRAARVVFPLPPPHVEITSVLLTRYSTTRKEHHMSFYDATVPAYPADSRQPLRPAHQGRGALQGKEHPARGAARRAALSGHAAADQADPDSPAISPPRAARALTHSEVPSTPDTEKTFEELQAAARQDHRLCEVVQAGAVRRRRHQGRHLPVGPNKTMTLKGQQFLSNFALPEFLLPCRHRPRHSAPQWRRRSASGIFWA